MTLYRRLPPLLRTLWVRPRLVLAAAVGLCVILFWPDPASARLVTRCLLGWNAGVWFYLTMAGFMMARSSPATMLHRAQEQDEGASAILMLVTVATLASLGAIVAELSVAKNYASLDRVAHIGLAVLTILASWAFMQVMFALHYAHDFYAQQGKGLSGGLQFPGTDQPNYADFVYFAVVIGTSGQTADVAFSNTAMRKVGTVHCALAFFFNTSLIALTINVASSLL
jgi:uncharacterized membrane protein